MGREPGVRGMTSGSRETESYDAASRKQPWGSRTAQG